MNKSAENNSEKVRSTPHTDDESITTSTESDSLETWTLVNDKKRKSIADNISFPSNSSNTNNKIELVATSFDDSQTDENKHTHESADPRADDDSNVDDISEGISIISESESAGRASPLVIAENFDSVELKSFSNLDDISPSSMLRLPIHIPQSSYIIPPTVEPSDQNTLRQRRFKHSSSNETHQKIILNTKNESIVETGLVYVLARRGLKGIFFICATLSILAFIGRLRNPDWQPFSSVNNLSVLEQKLTDLELQNNLMRAEIDILSKQVNYLSSLTESRPVHWDKVEREQKRHQRNSKQTGEWIMKQKGKTLKSAPNVEDNVNRVVLTKDVINKPFKCSSGNLFDGMCVKETEPIRKSMDDYIRTMDDVAADKIVEGVQSIKGESNADPENNSQGRGFHLHESGGKYKIYNKHFLKNGNGNSKEREYNKYDKQRSYKQKHKHQYQDSYDETDNDNDDDFSEEDEDFDDSLESFGKSKFSSKENNKNAQIRTNGGDKYKHRHKSDKLGDGSQERRFNIHSKETRYDDSAEHSLKNGDWHEKLMQQRENARRHNDFREHNKNWFIKRGDSREKMRHS